LEPSEKVEQASDTIEGEFMTAMVSVFMVVVGGSR